MKKIDFLTLFTTNKCNLKCIYCYTEAGEKRPDELDFSWKKKIVLDAKALGARAILLCGSGEPMLDADFYKLVEFIRSVGLYVSIATNGTLINEKNAKWLYDNRVFILFKLNSFDPKIADILVGKKNAYKWVPYKNKKIPYGLKCLFDVNYHKLNDKREKILGRYLQIESIISKYNLKDIPEIADFCQENNMFFHIESLLWKSQAKKNRDNLELSPKQYKWLYSRLKGKMEKSFFYEQKSTTCRIEKNPIIDYQGNIKICMSRESEIGNIKTTSLKKLFKGAQTLRKQQSTSFLRGLFNKKCFKTCSGREYYKKNH